MTDLSKNSEHVDKKSEEAPRKSFSINSILARVTKEKEKETEDKEDQTTEKEFKADQDIPAVVSKLEMPVFPILGKSFPGYQRGSDGNILSLGHLPVWYHWYASQQCLQQLQAEHKKSMSHLVH